MVHSAPLPVGGVYELRPGTSLLHPTISGLALQWNLQKGLVLGSAQLRFRSVKPHFADVHIRFSGRSVERRITYDTWTAGIELGRDGFDLMIMRPTERRADPRVFIRWRTTDDGKTQPAATVPESTAYATAESESPGLRRSLRLQLRAIQGMGRRPTGLVRCPDCIFFRTPAPVAQDLLTTLSNQIGPARTDTMLALENEERDARDSEELEYENVLDSADTMATNQELTWSRRPVAHGYCGLREARSIWLTVEAKNKTGECPDMRSKQLPIRRNSCASCRHNKLPPDDLIKAARACLASAEAEHLWDDVERELGQQAAFQVTGAYRMSGVLPVMPTLLPVCAQLSTPGRYAVGGYLNPDDACNKWENADGVPPLRTEDELVALRALSVAETARKTVDLQIRAQLRAASANIFAASQKQFWRASGEYDESRIIFLRAVFRAIGLGAGHGARLAMMVERTLHEASRWRG